jgi:integrase
VIIRDAYEQGAGEIKPYPKGRRRRGIPIGLDLAERLDHWMKASPAVPCTAKHKSGESCRGNLLIPSKSGSVLNYSNFRRDHWNPLTKSTKLHDVTPHDLRHTYASWLIQSGRVSIEKLSRLMGHRDIKTTQRYAHLGEAGWDEVRDVLDDDVATEIDDNELLAEIQRRAAQDPDRWAALFSNAKGADPQEPAPYLPHAANSGELAKIIPLTRSRRSTG